MANLTLSSLFTTALFNTKLRLLWRLCHPCIARLIQFQAKRSSFHEVMIPVNADAATVSGLARYNFPGPDRPWKLRLIAETVTCSGVIETPGPAPIHAPHPGSISLTPTRPNNSCQPLSTANCFTCPDPYWIKNSTPSLTMRPASSAALQTCA